MESTLHEVLSRLEGTVHESGSARTPVVVIDSDNIRHEVVSVDYDRDLDRVVIQVETVDETERV